MKRLNIRFGAETEIDLFLQQKTKSNQATIEMDVEKVKLSEKNCENNGEDGVIVSNVPIRTLSLGPVQANVRFYIRILFNSIQFHSISFHVLS